MAQNTPILNKDGNKLRRLYDQRHQDGEVLTPEQQTLKTLSNLGVLPLDGILDGVSPCQSAVQNIMAISKGTKGILTAAMTAAVEGKKWSTAYIAAGFLNTLRNRVTASNWRYTDRQCREVQVSNSAKNQAKQHAIDLIKLILNSEDGWFFPDSRGGEGTLQYARLLGQVDGRAEWDSSRRAVAAAWKAGDIWRQVSPKSPTGMPDKKSAAEHAAYILGIKNLLTQDDFLDIIGREDPAPQENIQPLPPGEGDGLTLNELVPEPPSPYNEGGSDGSGGPSGECASGVCSSGGGDTCPCTPVLIPIPSGMGKGEVAYVPPVVTPPELSWLNRWAIDRPGMVRPGGVVYLEGPIGDTEVPLSSVAGSLVSQSPNLIEGFIGQVRDGLKQVYSRVGDHAKEVISSMLSRDHFFPDSYVVTKNSPRLTQGRDNGYTLAFAPKAVRKGLLGLIPNLVEVDLSSCYTTLMCLLFKMPELEKLMGSSSFWGSFLKDFNGSLSDLGLDLEVPKSLLKPMWYATLFGGGRRAYFQAYSNCLKDGVINHSEGEHDLVIKAFLDVPAVREVKDLFRALSKQYSDGFFHLDSDGKKYFKSYRYQMPNGTWFYLRNHKSVRTAISYFFQSYEEMVMSYLTVKCWDSARVVLSQADGCWLYLIERDGLLKAQEAIREVCASLFNNPSAMRLEVVR